MLEDNALDRAPGDDLDVRLHGWLWQLSIELELQARTQGWPLEPKGFPMGAHATTMRTTRGRAVAGSLPLARSLLTWVVGMRAESQAIDTALADVERVLAELVEQLEEVVVDDNTRIAAVAQLLPDDDLQRRAVDALVNA